MIKVSDYIVDFLLKNQIDKCFTVTGGGAMHLNDSFGHNTNVTNIYCHQVQAQLML
jgi:acetolactate synthase-1/2/3 large subunit